MTSRKAIYSIEFPCPLAVSVSALFSTYICQGKMLIFLILTSLMSKKQHFLALISIFTIKLSKCLYSLHIANSCPFTWFSVKLFVLLSFGSSLCIRNTNPLSYCKYFVYGLEFLCSQMCPFFLSFLVSRLCNLLERSLPRFQESFPVLSSNTFIV